MLWARLFLSFSHSLILSFSHSLIFSFSHFLYFSSPRVPPKKNTSATRFFHATTAHFNTIYNGQVSYIEGVEAQERGHQDDYTRLLPMIISTNKSTAGMGKSNFDNAILKCEKAIKLHSIKKRPTVKSGKKLSAKDKEFRARKEFNPYLRHAWLMMGKAQFQKGEFIEAASTFNYVIRLYSTQPEVASVARAWLARCYVALEWPYDAEDVLDKMKRDSITPAGQRELAITQASYLIATEQYEKAIPELRKADQVHTDTSRSAHGSTSSWARCSANCTRTRMPTNPLPASFAAIRRTNWPSTPAYCRPRSCRASRRRP